MPWRARTRRRTAFERFLKRISAHVPKGGAGEFFPLSSFILLSTLCSSVVKKIIYYMQHILYNLMRDVVCIYTKKKVHEPKQQTLFFQILESFLPYSLMMRD